MWMGLWRRSRSRTVEGNEVSMSLRTEHGSAKEPESAKRVARQVDARSFQHAHQHQRWRFSRSSTARSRYP